MANNQKSYSFPEYLNVMFYTINVDFELTNSTQPKNIFQNAHKMWQSAVVSVIFPLIVVSILLIWAKRFALKYHTETDLGGQSIYKGMTSDATNNDEEIALKFNNNDQNEVM